MIRRSLLFISFILAAGLLIAQAEHQFPQDFVGNWKGELNWYPVGKPLQKIPMQLIVQPSKDTAGQYTWNIIYKEAATDNRPYFLKPVDSAKGHWMIDERNGILLDQYWNANRLTGSFGVAGSVILNSYYIDGKNLVVEFYSISQKPVRNSGNGTADSPAVGSFGLKSFQRAVLSRF